MTLLYLLGCCYGFPKSKRIFFPHIVPTTDILCGGFFPFLCGSVRMSVGTVRFGEVRDMGL